MLLALLQLFSGVCSPIVSAISMACQLQYDHLHGEMSIVQAILATIGMVSFPFLLALTLTLAFAVRTLLS